MSDQAMRELPRYKCHKEVWALKIKDVICHAHEDPAVSVEDFAKTDAFQGGHLFIEDDGFAPIPFDADWFRKHSPQPGGYYVVYKDGYKSFSPADAFEDGYAKVKPAVLKPTAPLSIHPSTAHLVQFFDFDHLPEILKSVSRPFCEMASRVLLLPDNPEKTECLRKLLEAKDCAVRSAIAK